MVLKRLSYLPPTPSRAWLLQVGSSSLSRFDLLISTCDFCYRPLVSRTKFMISTNRRRDPRGGRVWIKGLMVILALPCFTESGIISLAQGALARATDHGGGLSDAELQQVRERLPCLEPGMTMKEVFDVIGVDLQKKAYAEWGSGPTDDYRVVYQLAPTSNEHGYNLIVVGDRERKFKRAEIACWRESNKCAEDNEKAKNSPKACRKNSQSRGPVRLIYGRRNNETHLARV